MPPTPVQPSPALSADELNEQIRALWTDGRGHPTVRLDDEQRAEYRRLLAALEALRVVGPGDITTAA